MRIKDGMFEERWDVIQPEATKEESKGTSHVWGCVHEVNVAGGGGSVVVGRICRFRKCFR
jgi:hypothetical protein